jgi:hypothetical protein
VFDHEYEEELDPAVRASLMTTFYFDIRELERLLGRDLSSWYSSKSSTGG